MEGAVSIVEDCYTHKVLLSHHIVSRLLSLWMQQYGRILYMVLVAITGLSHVARRYSDGAEAGL